MKQYDVAVIGAGPAGAMAAYWLLQAGLDVLILEKTAFPREKTCGGGLTHRAYQEIPFNFEPVIHQAVTWGFVSANCRHIGAVYGQQPISYLIERSSFDALLLEKAAAQGTACVFNQRCLSLAQGDSDILITTDSNTYHSRYLVGADGVHSRVAQQLGLLTNRQTSLAYEARLAYPKDTNDPRLASITFDFGSPSWGYAWIFPKQDHLNVGVFRGWPGKMASKKDLMQFIDRHPSLSRTMITKINAHPIPLGGKSKRLHHQRALLVGDAANLADPWLGEGLGYALASARMAAEEILSHIRGEIPDLSGYSRKICESFDRQFTYARRLGFLIDTLPLLSVSLLQSSSTLQKMIIALLRGEKTYQETWQDASVKLPKKLFQKVFSHSEK